MKLLAMLLLLSTSSVFAVTVNNCPSRIKITVSDINAFKLDLTELYLAEEEEAALKEAVTKTLERIKNVSESLGLAIKEDSECRYGGYQLYGSAINPRAKLFTKNGDWLRFAFQNRNRDYGFYLNVKSYSREELVIDSERSIQLLLSHDDAHGEFSGTLPVASASKASVEVLDVKAPK